ncbi:MAG: cyclophilin-like fold protein [Rhodoplanes sp.]
MTRIRFDFGLLSLDAALLETPTASAITAALPITSSVLTWGEEVYFEIPVRAEREPDARAIITPGEIAYWPDGPAIAIGFGRTPISKGGETRLAAPCNVFARTTSDVKALASVKAGTKVVVTLLD